MCIKINKVGKQEVGIWWVQKRYPQYGIPIWRLWPNIRFLPPRRERGAYCFTSVLPSIQDIFRRIFLSNSWWQKSDIWSQASYIDIILNKMNCELILTYDTPALRQTGSRNLMGPKTLPTILFRIDCSCTYFKWELKNVVLYEIYSVKSRVTNTYVHWLYLSIK
jgi:hypothetical protein